MMNQLGINSTVFVMLGLFVATYVVVSQIALNPLAKGLTERSNRIDGREASIVKLKNELLKIQEDLAEQMKKARLEANSVFVELKNKATAEQRAILNAARETAAIEIKTARNNVAEKLKVEMKKLEDEIPSMAKQIVERILAAPAPQPKSGSAHVSTEI